MTRYIINKVIGLINTGKVVPVAKHHAIKAYRGSSTDRRWGGSQS
jgi:hypothetical protein